MHHIIIRAAGSDDHLEILPLATAFAATFAVDPHAFRQSFQNIIDDANAGLFVAQDEHQKVVGYVLAFVHATFFANGPVAWVEEITVEASQRRRGVGRALMNHVDRWAFERGARLMALATRRAESFYRALDYEDSATYFRKMLDNRA